MNYTKNIKWTSNIEETFKELGEKCYSYSYLHKKAESLFNKRSTFIDLPVIILSTAAGTLSIGNSNIFGKENEKTANMAIGCLSICISIMNTIGTYFSWSKRCENHRIVSIQYSKLYRFISIELSLPINERMAAGDILKICNENYERLQEISPLIPNHIIKDFKEKFKSYNVHKPAEANGLEEIKINRSFIIDRIEKEEEGKQEKYKDQNLENV